MSCAIWYYKDITGHICCLTYHAITAVIVDLACGGSGTVLTTFSQRRFVMKFSTVVIIHK